MADQVAPIGQGYQYYQPEYLKDMKLSDLQDNQYFLDDAVTFLKSRRKGYSDEDFQGMTAEDVVYDVLEHFRIMNSNEYSMGRDYFYMKDDNTPEQERAAYARLMEAFDNTKGEGWLDGGMAKVRDYAEGVLTAPSTYASVAAGALTAGAGTAAVQATKVGSAEALKALAKSQLKRVALTAAFDGSVAAAHDVGTQLIKQDAGQELGVDYDISLGRAAVAGTLGAAPGAIGGGIAMRHTRRGAQRMMDVLEQGEAAKVARNAEATTRAVTDLKASMATPEGRQYIRFAKDKLMAAIDPKLVEEGRAAKIDILSDSLPDGLIGGFDRNTIQRLSAASVELTRQMAKADPTFKAAPGQRITEFLALQMDKGVDIGGIFDKVAGQYGLTRRQLSAVYAAEVSDAARLLQSQKQWMTMAGKKLTGEEAKAAAGEYAAKLDKLWDEGLSPLSGKDAQELATAVSGMTARGKVYKTLRGVEDARRAFMTSQPATTIRNNIFGVAMTGIDALDEMFTALYKGLGGNFSEATATFKGSADLLAYLGKDHYVASTVTELLSQESPELMARVFQDAAQVELATQGPKTFGAKAGAFVNTLNTLSDHVFKRAVIAATINRELRKQGSSLEEYMKLGKMGEIGDDVINRALDDALAFTFQNRFGGKDASATSKAVDKGIGFMHRNFITTIIPFPRYLAAQAKFLKDYSVLNIAYNKGSLTSEEWAKQTTGALMLAGAYMMQRDNANRDLKWFEEDFRTGEVTNAQAAMGPTAPLQYLMSQFARMQEGLPTDIQNDREAFRSNVLNLIVGTEFRPGGTALDELWDTAASLGSEEGANYQPLMKVVGDYFGSFLYPAAVIKDFYGQFDPRSAYLPDTQDATVALHDLYGDTSSWVSLYQRVTRNLPDFNFEEMAATMKEVTGIDVSGMAIEGLFKHMGGTSRTQFQLDDPRNQDFGYDVVRYDIFGAGPIRVLDPLAKQFTGFTKSPPRTALQREMVRLNLDPFKVYNPYSEKNNALEYFVQQQLQGTLASGMELWMKTNEAYLEAADNPEFQRELLEEKIGNEISDVRSAATEFFTEWMSQSEKYEGDYQAFVRGEYKALGPSATQDSNDWWRERGAEEFGVPGISFEEAREKLKASEHYTEEEKVIMDAELLSRYIAGGKLARRAKSKL